MPYLVRQTFASISDPDVTAVVSNESTPPSETFLVLNHEPLGLGEKPSLTIAGHAITFGEVGSNAPYIAVRVSATQTVIKKTVHTIGEAVIGTNFVIQ